MPWPRGARRAACVLALGCVALLAPKAAVAAFTPGPFTDVAVTSITASWASTFPGGTTFYAQVSTNASFAAPVTSSDTLNLSATFSDLIANTTYYAQVATAPAGPFTSLSSTVTLVQVPTSVLFDEVSSMTIVAAAYAPTPAFSNLGAGLSGTNIAVDGVYQGWHGEKWTVKAAMPAARYALAAAAAGGKVYALGGYTTTPVATNTEYDPVTNAWTTKTALPAASDGLGAVAVGDLVHAFGGENTGGLLNTHRTYNPATNAWTTMPALPTARGNMAFTRIEDMVYALGGVATATLTSNDAFAPGAAAWSAKTALTSARYGFAAAVVNGKLYTFGGADAGVLKTDVDEYDPSSGLWTAKAPLPVARYELPAGAIGGKIYVVGGRLLPSLSDISLNEEYDPTANTWATRTPMPTPRMRLGAAVLNGRLYAIGGSTGTRVAVTEEYDPGTAQVFTGLTPNTQYSFKAKARSLLGIETGETTVFSTYTQAVVPAIATPTFTGVFATSVTLQWLANGNPGGTAFRLHASTAADFNAAASSRTGSWQTSLEVTISSLAAQTTWYFQARARNAVGIETAYANLGSTRTPEDVPSRLVILLGPQTLVDGVGVSGNPAIETAGELITVVVKAADAVFNFAPTVNKSGIRLTSDDPFVQSSWTLTLVNGVSISSIPLRSAGIRSFTVSDQSGAQPLLSAANSSTFTLSASNTTRLRVLLPGQTAVSGSTSTGRTGTPSDQNAGTPFLAAVHLTDSFWNLTPGASQFIRLVADDPYSVIVPTTQVVTASAAFTVTPARAGPTLLRAEMVDLIPPWGPVVIQDTATAVGVLAGVAMRLLTIVPGESFAPGTPSGKAGTPSTTLRAGDPFQVTVGVVDSANNLTLGRPADVRLKMPTGRLP